VIFELDVAVVRIKEYGHNVGWVEICNLVVLPQLQLANVKGCHKVLTTRLLPPSLEMV
jgi:hypothetical protein